MNFKELLIPKTTFEGAFAVSNKMFRKLGLSWGWGLGAIGDWLCENSGLGAKRHRKLLTLA